MQQAIEELFDRYESETNAALTGEPDMAAVTDLYDDAFLGASPAGVMAGKKDDDFRKALVAGFARNRKIGTHRMQVLGLRIAAIDAMHIIAHVDWRATYDSDGARKTIDFTNAYLVRVTNGKAKVFGWITGDEDAALREHGII